MESIDRIKQLSQAYFELKPSEPRLLVHYLQQGEALQQPENFNYVGGPALGLSLENQPKYAQNNEVMQQVLCLDLAAFPQLELTLKQDYRAVAVYVYNPSMNDAYQPFSGHSKMVFLTEAQVAQGFYEGNPEQEALPCHALLATPIEVPLSAFYQQNEDDYEADEEAEEQEPGPSSAQEAKELLAEIYKLLYRAPGILGGEPMWLQYEEHDGEFILQCDEQLIDINLGDMGVMYVFRDTAFWQCH